MDTVEPTDIGVDLETVVSAAVAAETTKATAQLAQKEDQVGKLQKSLVRLREAQMQHQKEHADLETTLKEWRDRAAVAEAECVALRQADLGPSLASAEAEIAELRDEVRRMEEARMIEKQVEDREAKDREAEVFVLRDELEKATTETASLRAEMAREVEKVAALLASAQEMEQKVEPPVQMQIYVGSEDAPAKKSDQIQSWEDLGPEMLQLLQTQIEAQLIPWR